MMDIWYNERCIVETDMIVQFEFCFVCVHQMVDATIRSFVTHSKHRNLDTRNSKTMTALILTTDTNNTATLFTHFALHSTSFNMPYIDYLLAIIPMVLPGWLLLDLMNGNPLQVIGRWIQHFAQPPIIPSVPPVESQLLAYVGVAVFGFVVTNRLIPNIQVS